MTSVIVDDEKYALDRMKKLIEMHSDIEVLASFISPEKAAKEIVKLKPDILFVDVEMPGMSGFDMIKKLKENQCRPVIVFVTAYHHYAIKAIREQAFDYLIKPIDIDAFQAMNTRLKGNNSNAQDIIKKIAVDHNLSEREQEILAHIFIGKSSQDIANELFLSKHTIDTHRRNILSKIGVDSIKELMLRSI